MGFVLPFVALAAACAVIADLQDPDPIPPAPVEEVDAGVDAPAPVDAGPEAQPDTGPKCKSIAFDDPLTTFGMVDAGDAGDGGDAGPTRIDAGAEWLLIHDGSNAPYPQIDPSPEGPAASLVKPNGYSNLGAIYLPKPIVIRAFDVSFRYLMTCAPEDAGGCSDGIAVVWLEATDAGAGPLQTYSSAATFGVPSAVKGGGVIFDVHQDTGQSDPPTPAVSTLAIDGVGTPGQYDWHTKNASYPMMNGKHDVALSLRAGVITVKIDGQPVVSGPVIYDFPAWFGIAASQGGQTGLFVVRNFKATFYECSEP
jgi:hypothetical protein